MVEFVKDQDIPAPLEFIKDRLLIIDRKGLIGRYKSILTSQGIQFVRGRSDCQPMAEHLPKERVKEVPLALVLEGGPGTDPAKSIGKTGGDQLSRNDRKGRFATARRNMDDDLSEWGPGDDFINDLLGLDLVEAFRRHLATSI